MEYFQLCEHDSERNISKQFYQVYWHAVWSVWVCGGGWLHVRVLCGWKDRWRVLTVHTDAENGGKMVEMWSYFGTSTPWARGLVEPWTWWIGSAPVQMSGCCLGGALSWFAWWAACGGWLFFIDPSFLVNSHFDHSRAWIPACSLTAALIHRFFPSNLFTTTQRAIVKLRGASSELCTLFIWSE